MTTPEVHRSTSGDSALDTARSDQADFGRRGQRRLRDRITTHPGASLLFLVLAGFALLVITGTTTSSIGVEMLRDDPAVKPPGLVGHPQSIRSDEFLRTTPWRLGMLATGGTSFGTPLAQPDVALTTSGTGGPVTTVVFADSTLLVTVGRVIPQQAFALVWWLPVLLVTVLLPGLLRRFGVGWRFAAPAAVLVVASPAAAWWSYGPLTALAPVLVAAGAAVAGVDLLRRRDRSRVASVGGLVLILLAALGLARSALSYQPWSIPLAIAILVPTAAVLLRPQDRRGLAAISIAGVCVAGGLVLLGFLAEHRTGLDVLSQTVYPGARRLGGSLLDVAQMFAAPHLWVLQTKADLVGTNASEITSTYLALGLAVLVVAGGIGWPRVRPDLRMAALTSAVTLGLLATWCAVSWPDAAAQLFPMNLVPPGRLVAVLGIPATITFVLVLQAWAQARVAHRLPVAVTSGVLVFFATAAGGSFLRQVYLPSMRAVLIWVMSLAFALAVGVAVGFATKRWALLPLTLLVVPVVAVVNPVQVGFADLTSGQAAATVQQATEQLPGGGRWANDDLAFDALLMANGAPSISGQQWIGPQESSWRLLDPTGRFRDVWNRGSSYVTFTWADPGSATDITNPGTDVIRVTADPCAAPLRSLGLASVVSTRPLTNHCLKQTDTVAFGGVNRWVYSLDR